MFVSFFCVRELLHRRGARVGREHRSHVHEHVFAFTVHGICSARPGEHVVVHLNKAAAAAFGRRRLVQVADEVLTQARSHRVQIRTDTVKRYREQRTRTIKLVQNSLEKLPDPTAVAQVE